MDSRTLDKRDAEFVQKTYCPVCRNYLFSIPGATMGPRFKCLHGCVIVTPESAAKSGIKLSTLTNQMPRKLSPTELYGHIAKAAPTDHTMYMRYKENCESCGWKNINYFQRGDVVFCSVCCKCKAFKIIDRTKGS